MVKSIWESIKGLVSFIVTGLCALAGIITIFWYLGFTERSFLYILICILILIIIYLLLLKKPQYKISTEENSPTDEESEEISTNEIIICRTYPLTKEIEPIEKKFKKGTKLTITIYSKKPVDFYLLNARQFNKENEWRKSKFRWLNITDLEEECLIPNSGKWFFVIKISQLDPSDIAFSDVLSTMFTSPELQIEVIKII